MQRKLMSVKDSKFIAFARNRLKIDDWRKIPNFRPHISLPRKRTAGLQGAALCRPAGRYTKNGKRNRRGERRIRRSIKSLSCSCASLIDVQADRKHHDASARQLRFAVDDESNGDRTCCITRNYCT